MSLTPEERSALKELCEQALDENVLTDACAGFTGFLLNCGPETVLALLKEIETMREHLVMCSAAMQAAAHAGGGYLPQDLLIALSQRAKRARELESQ